MPPKRGNIQRWVVLLYRFAVAVRKTNQDKRHSAEVNCSRQCRHRRKCLPRNISLPLQFLVAMKLSLKPFALAIAALMIPFLLALWIAAIPHKAKADDASCAHSKNPVNCLVKNNAELKALSDEMKKNYAERMARMDADEKEALRYQQQHWLESPESSCGVGRRHPVTEEKLPQFIKCLADFYRDRIESLTQRCEVDESHTVEEMATWKTPWSGKVPAGFKIDNRMLDFVVAPENLINTESYNLPSNELPQARKVGGMLKFEYREVAQCRVQDPEGHWWLAIRHVGGDLSYVREEESETVAQHDEKAAQGRKQAAEERKQLQQEEHQGHTQQSK